MAKHTLLILEDDPASRDHVLSLLRVRADLEILPAPAPSPRAAEQIEALRPAILFVAANPPKLAGLHDLERLDPYDRPPIILASAEPRLAVDAFRMQAVDFLLKPLKPARLAAALTHAIASAEARHSAEILAQIERNIANPGARHPGRLVVRLEARVIVLQEEEVSWLEAANNYSLIHLADKRRLMIREPMSTLAERLNPDDFIRIHRSTIVRSDQVRELQPTKYGDYLIVLRDGTRLPVSRSLRGRLAKLVATAR
jgi:two-component system, LytTR family, response regulator